MAGLRTQRVGDVARPAPATELDRLRDRAPVRFLGPPVGDTTMATTLDPQIKLAQILDTLIKLSIRFKQRELSLQGLSKTYTIDGTTARAHAFLFGDVSREAKEKEQAGQLRELLAQNTMELLPTLVKAITSQRENPESTSGALTTLALDDAR